MNTASEKATSPRLTPGETLAAVSSCPTTVHGWRPISVRTQPKMFAASAAGSAAIATRYIHRCRGSAPRRVSHRPITPTPTPASPSPIISRNDQYRTGMFGV